MNLSCFVNGSQAVLNQSCPNNYGQRLLYPEAYRLTSTVLMSILIPVIVIGNAFVIWAFITTRRLRTTTNYFVLSLAVADVLVGSLTLPIFTIAMNKGPQWKENPAVKHLFTAVDIITAMASILNLMYISVDRYICIKFPLRYHALLTKTKVTIMIAVSWLYGVLYYILVRVTYMKGRPQPSVMLAITIMTFILPLTIIVVMYANVGRIALGHKIRMRAIEERNNAERNKKGTISLLKELKATRTLAVVIGTFVLCWIGYFTELLYTSICQEWRLKNCTPLPWELVLSILWIKYFNSSLNPFIYAVMDGDMRNALKRFLRRRSPLSESNFELLDTHELRSL